MAGTCVLGYATTAREAGSPHAAMAGIIAALGAGILWGTMYIPYRKAYLSGMNPLSFVTVFTIGELAAVLLLALVFDHGVRHLRAELARARPALFWLFLGGFCWVIGDVFQQYAAKYVGIGRGIPLSNTDQIWGLAWGILAFGEGAGLNSTMRVLIVGGSLLTIAGAMAISFAEAPEAEQRARDRAIERECSRYGLDPERLAASLAGGDPLARERPGRSKWELSIAAAAAAIFIWLAMLAKPQPIAVDVFWTVVLSAAALAVLLAAGRVLWRRTRFS
jgi:hypothetical protein